MNPVSYVSCVSWMHWVNAAETHETFHRKSGMRYQIRPFRPDPRSDRAFLVDATLIRTLKTCDSGLSPLGLARGSWRLQPEMGRQRQRVRQPPTLLTVDVPKRL